MNELTNTPSVEESKNYLESLAIEHLGLPRLHRARLLAELEDCLLPGFLQMSHHAWNAAAPLTPVNDPSIGFFVSPSPPTDQESKIRRLNEVLEDLGIHDLLKEVAASPHSVNLPHLPLDAYEVRLLRGAGHPKAETALDEYLTLAASKHEYLNSSRTYLEKAALMMGIAREDAHSLQVGGPDGPPPVGGPKKAMTEAVPKEKPKRRKLFTGLGSLASGLVLLAGDPIIAASVAITGPIALTVLGSIAGGMAAVGKGIGDLRREGE